MTTNPAYEGLTRRQQIVAALTKIGRASIPTIAREIGWNEGEVSRPTRSAASCRGWQRKALSFASAGASIACLVGNH